MASGPSSVFSSNGSPTCRLSIRATNFFSNSAAIGSATMKRLAAMQDCPLFCTRAVTAVSTAASEIGAGHHDKRIAPAQFEHNFLDALGRAHAYLNPRLLASRQRRRDHARIVQQTRRPRPIQSAASETRPREIQPQEKCSRSPARTAARSTHASAVQRCPPSAPARRSETPARRENSTASPPESGRSADTG